MSKKAATPAEPKAPKATTGPKMPIGEYLAQLADNAEAQAEEGDEDGEGHGKIWHILKCYTRGYSRVDIVKAGFNRSTVYRQVGEYDKLRKAPATHYQGFEVFEMRVKRLMGTKKITREKAVEIIYAKDLD